MSTSRSRPMASPSALANGDSKGAAKASKPSKIITLVLPPGALGRFPSTPASSRKGTSRSKSSTSDNSTPNPAAGQESPADAVSESNSTPGPGSTPGGTALPADASKRKGMPGPKPGAKRGLAQTADTGPKVRGKPGPKKKPRLEDGTIDHRENSNGTGTGIPTKPANPTAPVPGAHKLGPKANQGAINAGLRALDRSGKPSRKWERKGFTIKSFTGVVWDMSSWRTPKSTAGEANGDAPSSGVVSRAGESDSKENKGSSGIDSEKSNSAGDVEMTTVETNDVGSPALPVAIPA
ncbi:MAG: hypothetical protein M1837_007072 [Sclerophora amabilis]|nr:MAG: hypothetical protein M1837_007072 [Sclerophora amabilis]